VLNCNGIGKNRIYFSESKRLGIKIIKAGIMYYCHDMRLKVLNCNMKYLDDDDLANHHRCGSHALYNISIYIYIYIYIELHAGV